MTPYKLDKELQKKIAFFVQNGASIEDACLNCGIHKTSYYKWIKKGKKDSEGVYHDFMQHMEKAQAKNKMFHINNINKHAEKSWQASAWMLERRYPEEFSRPEIRNDINVESNKDMTIKIVGMVKDKNGNLVEADAETEENYSL